MKVRLITHTEGKKGTEFEGKTIDEIIVGIARVSSSREVNELFDEPHKLLRHCLAHGHWSIFDTCNLTFEIKTSRAIARELMRHDVKRQELSFRYAEATEFEPIELREQAKDNRQSSTEIIGQNKIDIMLDNGLQINSLDEWTQNAILNAEETYRYLLEQGVARECARFVLPETTTTTLYLNGTIRVWLSILNQRLHHTAQKEIRLIAQEIRDQFIQICPVISKMMFNFENAEQCHIFERIILEKYGVYDIIKSNNFKKLKEKK